MPTYQYLRLYQSNDEQLTGTVLAADGAAQDLTGVTLDMFLKPSPETADDDPSVTVLSTSTGEISIDDAAAGTYTVTISDSVLTTVDRQWYRIDATTGGSTRTVTYGPLEITDL